MLSLNKTCKNLTLKPDAQGQIILVREVKILNIIKVERKTNV